MKEGEGVRGGHLVRGLSRIHQRGRRDHRSAGVEVIPEECWSLSGSAFPLWPFLIIFCCICPLSLESSCLSVSHTHDPVLGGNPFSTPTSVTRRQTSRNCRQSIKLDMNVWCCLYGFSSMWAVSPWNCCS